MTELIALVSAIAVGASDFFGSQATRKSRPELVPYLAHLASLVFMFIGALFIAAPLVVLSDFYWGISAGLSGGFGIYLLFRAMAHAQISVVAPIAAVAGSLTTVAFGVAGGDRPSWLNLIGIAMAIVAGAVISSVATDEDSEAEVGVTTSLKEVGESIAAGVLFGWFFVSLSHTADDAGLWPLVIARVVSVLMLGLLAYFTSAGAPLRARLWADGSVIRLAIAAGALEALASTLLLVALRRGELSIVGVLASLYPISTVLLAAVVLREKLANIQWFAVVMALIAVPLISL